MSENESYYEYAIEIQRNPDGPGLNPKNPLITDVVSSPLGTWYRFKIPLEKYGRAVNGISDFRSIRFMRMFLTGFNRRTTLRFATLDLVRNQWRKISRENSCGTDAETAVIIDAVNIEEHSDREPFRYDIPLGIQRERISSATYSQDVYQNEQSLVLRYNALKMVT
jgi:cell surface protein SprA